MVERPANTAAAGDVGFGGLLRSCRERRFLSQERLAEQSGLSTRTIRDLETGKVHRPRAASVRLLADALGLEGWECEQFEEAARPSPAGQLAGQPVPRLAEGVASSHLPPDVADFVGRSELIRQLRGPLARRLDGMAGQPDVAAVVISVVTGKLGVGKGARAVNVAHQLAAEFLDGQLYVSFRGAGAGGESLLDLAETLGRFLHALGADSGAIPAGAECGPVPRPAGLPARAGGSVGRRRGAQVHPLRR
jgi:transcriptional regulator with XRE-family HTH domain